MGHMGGVGAVAFSKKWKNFFVSGSRLALPQAILLIQYLDFT
jgi:hypothetical protein